MTPDSVSLLHGQLFRVLSIKVKKSFAAWELADEKVFIKCEDDNYQDDQDDNADDDDDDDDQDDDDDLVDW